MKTAVVYNSGTGFTKQYAEWIAQELDCEAVSIKDFRPDTANSYDVIVYGGWIMGNMINGLDKIRAMNPEKLVIFATGSSEAGEEINKAVIKTNHLQNDIFFYMPAGFKFEKLNFFVRMMLKSLKKRAAKAENPTPQEKYMAQKLGTSFDISDRSYINPLVEAVRSLT